MVLILGCGWLAACGPGSGTVSTQQLANDVDTWTLTVRVPPSYARDDGRRYPWILQLDGRVPSLMELDVTSRAASDLEAAGALNEVIVVGINSASGEGEGKGRNRDYTIPGNEPDPFGGTGGAPQFLSFVRSEVIPFVEREYRVKPGREGRALFGHSLGGLFGAFTFVEADAPPFDFICAASPSLVYVGGVIHGQLEAMDSTRAVPRTVLLTAGTLEGPEMVVSTRRFAQQAQEKNFSGLEVFEQEFPVDHIGNVEPSFRAALQLLHSRGWDQ